MKNTDFSIIKTLRMKWGLTAEELAARADITRATVAKIESGKGNPTIETIGAISRVFHLAVSELVRMAEVAHVEQAASTPFKDKNLTGSHIRFPDFETYRLNAKSGESRSYNPGYHENTAEVCLVISGKIRVTVQDETHELGPDAAIRFKALHEHRIEVVDDAEFLMIHHDLR